MLLEQIEAHKNDIRELEEKVQQLEDEIQLLKGSKEDKNVGTELETDEKGTDAQMDLM